MKEQSVEYYPLTHPQKAIWMTEKVYPGTSIGNISYTIKFKGKIDYQILEESLNLFIANNDAMRIQIIDCNGEPKQYISGHTYRKFDFFDFSGKSIEEFYKWEEQQSRVPFELEDSDLFYCALVKIDEETGGIFGRNHHLIADAWTMTVMSDQVVENYINLKNNARIEKENEPSYLEYIIGEEAYKKSDKFLKEKEFWMGKFEKMPELTTLKARTTNSISTKAKRKTFITPLRLTEKINQFCRDNRTSVFSLFLSTLSMYISRVTQKENIIVGTTVLNRSNFKEKNTVGMFISTVPLRIQINDTTDFKTFVDNITREWKAVLKNQRYPYDVLLREVRDKFKITENLYDISLSYQNAKFNKSEHAEDYDTRWHFNGRQVESLVVHINDREDEGHLIINYDYLTDLFHAKEIDFIHQHIINLLWHALDNPNKEICKVEMLSEKEKHKILYDFNNTKTDYPKEKTIHQLFEEQVEKTPDNTALVFEDKKMTYRELNEKANQLARVLRKRGVRSDDIVGLMVHRSFEMIIGILGIIKAGGAYLPIDPFYPKDRIEFMLEDSGTRILLTEEELDEKIEFSGEKIYLNIDTYNNYDKNNIENNNKPDDLIYVIYTSGSTGKPKGVMINHLAVNNFIKAITDKIDFNSNKAILNITTISFDIFVLETLLPLTTGLKVIIPNEEQHRLPKYINELMVKNNILMLQTTPSRMQMIIADEQSHEFFKNLTEVMVGGESFPQTLLEKLRSLTNAKIYNMYGPTETTVWSSIKEFTDSDIINIGKPIANTQMYILDKNNNQVPIGIIGELYIGGDGLSKGYFGREELTRERFIENPFIPNSKIYKTGDLARWYSGGEIEHLGRTDFQVKIRGFRIELEEIENQLLKNESIEKTVVIAKEDASGKKFLIAYIVSKKEISIPELKSFLLQELPDYMIPAYFMRIDSLPLTPNGKVNRNMLPDPDGNNELTVEYVPPSNPIEEWLVKTWEKILDIKRAGINDNFFDFGGDSLDASILITDISKEYGVDISYAEMIKIPTIKQLANYIRENKGLLTSSSDKNLFLFRKSNPKKNIFFLHTGIGEISGYIPLINLLNEEYSCWGIKPDRLDCYAPRNVLLEDMAKGYIEKIRKIQDTGPYYFVGWCIGGNLIFEMMLLLESMDEETKLGVMIDSIAPCTKEYINGFNIETEREMIKGFIPSINMQLPDDIEQLWSTIIELIEKGILDERKVKQAIPIETARAVPNFETASARQVIYYLNAMRGYGNSSARYIPSGKLDTKMIYIDAIKENRVGNIEKWNLYLNNPLTVYQIDADHFTIMRDPNSIAQIAKVINSSLE
ncbi:MAG: amino acid adenylation domain-containing protein [Ignavibacteriales bacterium]